MDKKLRHLGHSGLNARVPKRSALHEQLVAFADRKQIHLGISPKSTKKQQHVNRVICVL
jgi:hypothetical protein